MIATIEQRAEKSPVWRQVKISIYFLFVAIPIIVWLSVGPDVVDRVFPVLTDVEILARDRTRTDALVFRFSFDKKQDCSVRDLSWYGVSKGGVLEFASFTTTTFPDRPPVFNSAPATRPPGLALSGTYTVYLPNKALPKFQGVLRYDCPYFGMRSVILGPWDNWLAPTSPTQALAPSAKD